jgi:hypothetical protein
MISLPNEKPTDIFVFDLTGKLVNHKQVTSSSILLDLERVPKGVYLLKAVSENVMGTNRIVIE